MKSSYQLIPRVVTPSINPGDKIEIDFFISGYGPVKKCKLNIFHSSKKLINEKDPGKIEWSIQVAKDKTTNKIIQPVSGNDYKGKHNLDHVGAFIYLNEGFFLDDPRITSTPFGLARIMSENTWDKLFPLSMMINTLKDVSSGNYTLDLNFTYSDGDEISTNHKTVVIHVRNWKEKNEKKLWFIGIIGAVALAIVTQFF